MKVLVVKKGPTRWLITINSKQVFFIHDDRPHRDLKLFNNLRRYVLTSIIDDPASP